MPTDIPKLLQSITQEQNRVFEGIMTRLNSYTPTTIEKQFHERDIKSGAMQQLLDGYRAYQSENRTLLAMGNPEAINGLEDLKRQILAFNARSATNGAQLEAIQKQANLGDQNMMGIVQQYSSVFDELANPTPVNIRRQGTQFFIEENDGTPVSLVDSEYHKKTDLENIQVNIEPIEFGARKLISDSEYYNNYISTVNQGMTYDFGTHVNAVNRFVEDELKYQTTNFSPTYAQYSLNYLERVKGGDLPKDPQELQKLLVDNAMEIKNAYVQELSLATYQAPQSRDIFTARNFKGNETVYNDAKSITTPNPDQAVKVGSNDLADLGDKYDAKLNNDNLYQYNIDTYDQVIGADSDLISSNPQQFKQINFGNPWNITENFNIHYQDGQYKDVGEVQGNVIGITSPIFAYTGENKSDLKLDDPSKVYDLSTYEMLNDKMALAYLEQMSGQPLQEYTKNATSLKEVWSNMINDGSMSDIDALQTLENLNISPVRYAVVKSGKSFYHVPLEGEDKDAFFNQLDSKFSNSQENFVLNSFDSLFNMPASYVSMYDQALSQSQQNLSPADLFYQQQQLSRTRPVAPPKAP